MKNLINSVNTEYAVRISNFIAGIEKEKNVQAILDKWQYKQLIPKSSTRKFEKAKELKEYLISRYEKEQAKKCSAEISKIKTIEQAGTFDRIKISVEWKKSRMWGNNPNAEAYVSLTEGSGYTVNSGSIGGCGYDKLSTAIANAVNQSNEVLKLLYTKKNKAVEANNRELFGYGSGYGLLPYLEGGVGVSCYPKIFESLGYEFRTVASGKTYDVYEITKAKKNRKK